MEEKNVLRASSSQTYVDPEKILLAIEKIDGAIQITSDVSLALDNVIHEVMKIFKSDRAWLFYPCNPKLSSFEVVLGNRTIDEDTASRYPELNTGPHVQLCVSDTGDGINPEIVDRVFDPYFTTKDVGKGIGLGLSVVHGIVNSHHGRISVESKPEKGTTFSILFPALERVTRDEPKEFQELPTGKERILFVDDEGAMVNLNQQRLERLGYKVIPKTDPLEALAFFSANSDQIDLIITDMTMPNMTGDRLAQEILKIISDMPIILCTGYSSRISGESAQNLGIRKYIEKPIEMANLARSVREVLDGRTIA